MSIFFSYIFCFSPFRPTYDFSRGASGKDLTYSVSDRRPAHPEGRGFVGEPTRIEGAEITIDTSREAFGAGVCGMMDALIGPLWGLCLCIALELVLCYLGAWHSLVSFGSSLYIQIYYYYSTTFKYELMIHVKPAQLLSHEKQTTSDHERTVHHQSHKCH